MMEMPDSRTITHLDNLRQGAKVRCRITGWPYESGAFTVRPESYVQPWEMTVHHEPHLDGDIGFVKMVCQGVPIEKSLIPKSFFYTFVHQIRSQWTLVSKSTPDGPQPVPQVSVVIQPL